MSSAFVFPGGVMEESDKEKKWFELLKKKDCQLVKPNETELAFKVCALREVFEETGLFISSPVVKQSLVQEKRKQVEKNASVFFQLFKETKSFPQVDKLKKWSRWITPVFEKYRYDTLFYAILVDEYYAKNTVIDEREVTTHLWMTPEEALQKFEKKEINLFPPTFLTIADMLRFKDVQSLFNAERCPLPILPVPFPFSGDFICIALPGDEKYVGESSVENKGVHRVKMQSTQLSLFEYECNLERKHKNFLVPQQFSSIIKSESKL